MKNPQFTKVVICIGLNDRDTKKQVINTRDALNIVGKSLCRHFAGSTLTICDGIYTHDDGMQVSEKSFSIALYYTDQQSIYAFCDEVGKKLNQESITIEFNRAGLFGTNCLSVEFYKVSYLTELVYLAQIA